MVVAERVAEMIERCRKRGASFVAATTLAQRVGAGELRQRGSGAPTRLGAHRRPALPTARARLSLPNIVRALDRAARPQKAGPLR